MHPVSFDGGSLVILRERSNLLCVHYEVIESGVLMFDGQTLTLEHTDGSERTFSEQEQQNLLIITPEKPYQHHNVPTVPT
jgi:hypothetical protein